VFGFEEVLQRQRAAEEQQAADEYEHGELRLPWNAPRRQSKGEEAGIDSGGWPGRIETRSSAGTADSQHQFFETEDGSEVGRRNSDACRAPTEELSREMLLGAQRLG
jgi:hypothetical protein